MFSHISSYYDYFLHISYYFSLFFFNDPATTEIYTLSLHDALPISRGAVKRRVLAIRLDFFGQHQCKCIPHTHTRSEEHTSELQSRVDLVCRLLLEKKKKKKKTRHNK